MRSGIKRAYSEQREALICAVGKFAYTVFQSFYKQKETSLHIINSFVSAVFQHCRAPGGLPLDSVNFQFHTDHT